MDDRQIVVIGSTNMDMVVKTTQIPPPGTTIMGGDFFMNRGGKGANQAVAASRLDGDVLFITRVGNDLFGQKGRELFDTEGFETGGLIIDEAHPSGIALITVDEFGENSIVVAPGANAHLNQDDIDHALRKVKDIGVMLLQLEIPVDSVLFAAQKGSDLGAAVILNPAPVHSRTKELFPYIDILTPNGGEAHILSGIPVEDVASGKQAALKIHLQGVENVLVTLGGNGVVVMEKGITTHIPAERVTPLDTTGAGDSFNGALAVALAEGRSLVDAARFACKVAAIVVTKLGAQSAMPYRRDISSLP